MAGKPLLRADPVRLITAENGQCRRSGTCLANNRNILSCDPSAASRRQQTTWGGPRNSALRTSDQLSAKQVAGLVEAAEFAFARDRIFQRHWTVHYGLAGIEPQDGAQFVGRLIDLASKQAKREGGRLTALWVRECASLKGEHVHMLLHLPGGMKLHGRTRRWIEAAGGSWRRGVSKVSLIGGQLPRAGGNRSQRQRENAANVVRYLLKAANPEATGMLDLTRSGEGGRVIGKRCGVTQNIGKGARDKFRDVRPS